MVKPKSQNNKKKKDSAKNGAITTFVRLSIAIRFFACGDPHNISVVHGISHKEVYRSVWHVVDAVNQCSQLAFSFPDDHAKQEEISWQFKRSSDADFDCCVGCINRMLL
jgi:hypothetical protein